jgi:NDP-mannose synthase
MLAVVMAGGRGTRLSPYTTVLPKPLMPLHDRPIIDVILRQLVAAGIDAISISVGHLGALIEAWVRSAGYFDVPISFVYEDLPLGTAGALKLAAPEDESFIVLNGDILTTLLFPALVEAHVSSGAVATLAVNERRVDIEYGVVHRDSSLRLIGFEEKPAIRYTVSMGVYAFAARVVDYIETGERIDLPDLLIRMLDAGERVAVFPFEGYWRDIGNRDDYGAAIDDFSAAPERFIPGTTVGMAQDPITTPLSPPFRSQADERTLTTMPARCWGLIGTMRSEPGLRGKGSADP